MEERDWDEKAGHPMQSWVWGEFRGSRQKVSRVVADNQFLIVWTRISGTPWVFGYIPMGPLPSEKDIEVIKKEATKNRAIGVRMEPLVLKGQENEVLKKMHPGRHLFKQKTFWWDLKMSEEELLGKMHPKCRYNIRLAEKKGVEIYEDNSDDALESYLHLMFERTAKRQKIYAHSIDYHRKLWKALSAAGMASLFLAKYEGKTVATWMVFKWRKWLYYAYGAFDDDVKAVMAPVLGLWKIALWGKKDGFEMMDLWGAEEGKGFSRFKEQFGPSLVELAGAFDVIVQPLPYWLFRRAEEVRWKILRMWR
jgi:lipid II:glycine glycyltransferase (peptidoglycan interpeptide bridge formation enzyme)